KSLTQLLCEARACAQSNPATRGASLPGLIDQSQSDGRLARWRPKRWWHTGGIEAFLVCKPAARQIDPKSQWHCSRFADMKQSDGKLAIHLSSQAAAELPLHADGMPALLDEGHLLNAQHALRIESWREPFEVNPADVVLVPWAAMDEMLQCLG